MKLSPQVVAVVGLGTMITTSTTTSALSFTAPRRGAKHSWHSKSAFSGRSRSHRHRGTGVSAALTMYDSKPGPPSADAWTVLATTEKWISSTLSACGTETGNPYTRKEVSYVCETNAEAAMIVAGVFRRIKEAREKGEAHGVLQEELKESKGEGYEPRTFRQTQVVVIPTNKALESSFPLFDKLVEAINQARRNARDYVTDVSLEKLDDRLEAGEEGLCDWSVSVNCAHLHPSFGEKTPEEAMQELKDEEEAGEVDLNYEEYKKKRILARQSPFPTVVIEVRAAPPPDFGASSPQSQQQRDPAASTASGDKENNNSDKEGVTAADVARLEALFGKSAQLAKDSEITDNDEDGFYNSIGQSIQEVSAVTTLNMAQQWIAENDPAAAKGSAETTPVAAFTETDTAHVDSAYEFVFTNIAMMADQATAKKEEGTKSQPQIQRQYLCMPHFLSSAATSFEKFSKEVAKISAVLPELRDNVTITTFHPEHIDPAKRSPVPIFALKLTN